MQNKLCTVQFFSPADDQFAAWKKVWTPGQERIQNSCKTEKPIVSHPLLTPFINWAWMVWNISIDQLGCLSVYAPSCTPAH